MDNDQLTIECVGAGKIVIDVSPHSRCGGRVGFNFGVTWGAHGLTGGVLPIGEAEKIIKMLSEQLSKHLLKTPPNITAFAPNANALIISEKFLNPPSANIFVGFLNSLDIS